MVVRTEGGPQVSMESVPYVDGVVTTAAGYTARGRERWMEGAMRCRQTDWTNSRRGGVGATQRVNGFSKGSTSARARHITRHSIQAGN